MTSEEEVLGAGTVMLLTGPFKNQQEAGGACSAKGMRLAVLHSLVTIRKYLLINNPSEAIFYTWLKHLGSPYCDLFEIGYIQLLCFFKSFKV